MIYVTSSYCGNIATVKIKMMPTFVRTGLISGVVPPGYEYTAEPIEPPHSDQIVMSLHPDKINKEINGFLI